MTKLTKEHIKLLDELIAERERSSEGNEVLAIGAIVIGVWFIVALLISTLLFIAAPNATSNQMFAMGVVMPPLLAAGVLLIATGDMP